MTEIPKEFFLDEVRDGFFIPSMMKRSWAAMLSNYKELERLALEHRVSLFVVWGSMLGAVRHGGFVPWDDDVDVAMLRESYNLIRDCAERGELPGDHWIDDHVTGDSENMKSRWLDSRDAVRDQEGSTKNYGFPFVNIIDIDVVDYLPDSERDRETYRMIIEILAQLKERAKNVGPDAEIAAQINRMAGITGFDFDWEDDDRVVMQILQMMDHYCETYTAKECKDVSILSYYMDNHTGFVLPKEYLTDCIPVDFEYSTVMLPVGYEKMLRTCFGDYMTPVIEFTSHRFPYYRAMEEDLKEQYGIEFMTYHLYPEVYDRIIGLRDEKRNEYLEKHADGAVFRKVVFLCYRAEHWKSLHTLWEREVQREDTVVTVIPVPYYLREFDGSVNRDEMIIETEGYPGEVMLTAYDAYDMEAERPDEIIIQCPYDEYSMAMTVHPYYYVSNLYPLTEKIVFIPPFYTRDIHENDMRIRSTLRDFVLNPGLIYADEIIVQSEGVKKAYVDMLSDFVKTELGEVLPDGELPGYTWEQKIIAGGSGLKEWEDRGRILVRSEGTGVCYEKSGKETEPTMYDTVFDVPDEWIDAMKRDDGSFRKLMIYHLCGSMLYDQGIPEVERAKKILETMREHGKDIAVLWFTDKYAKEILDSRKPGTWKAYQELVMWFTDKNIGILDESGDDERVSALCDAYFGDASVIMNKCRMKGKPVMWATPGTDV